MKPTLKLTLAFFTALFTLAFTGCNDGGSDDKAGPAAASSFAGASISFNPTVNFLAGNALTYINTEAGSPFPAAATATNGTYTYVPNANFTAGTLTLTVDGISDPIVLEISNFAVRGGKVTRFTARSGGQNFPVTVTGTIAARTSGNNNGGGNLGANETRADDIPSSMRGSYDLTFHKDDGTTAIAGVPADGTETTFVIGARTLKFNGRTLTDPIFYAGNELEWLFKDGNIWWAVSIAVDGGLNEINVQGPYTGSGNAFYGQYNDRAPGSGVGSSYNSIGIALNGSYRGGSFLATVASSGDLSTTPNGSEPLDVPQLTQSSEVLFVIGNDDTNGNITTTALNGTFTFNGQTATQVNYAYLDDSVTPNITGSLGLARADASSLPTSGVLTLRATDGGVESSRTYNLMSFR